jgi:hypothetical protein
MYGYFVAGLRRPGHGNYKLYFADPPAGQVGFFGTIEEHGHTVILGLRLKVENKKIGEMEVIGVRKTSGVFSEPQNLVDKPIFHQALAPSERRPRAELIRVANSYFEGWKRAPTRTLRLTRTASGSRTA